MATIQEADSLMWTKARMKPTFVRYARIFCAGAILTIIIADLSTGGILGEAAEMGIGAAGGTVVTLLAKKFALLA